MSDMESSPLKRRLVDLEPEVAVAVMKALERDAAAQEKVHLSRHQLIRDLLGCPSLQKEPSISMELDEASKTSDSESGVVVDATVADKDVLTEGDGTTVASTKSSKVVSDINTTTVKKPPSKIAQTKGVMQLVDNKTTDACIEFIASTALLAMMSQVDKAITSNALPTKVVKKEPLTYSSKENSNNNDDDTYDIDSMSKKAAMALLKRLIKENKLKTFSIDKVVRLGKKCDLPPSSIKKMKQALKIQAEHNL